MNSVNIKDIDLKNSFIHEFKKLRICDIPL